MLRRRRNEDKWKQKTPLAWTFFRSFRRRLTTSWMNNKYYCWEVFDSVLYLTFFYLFLAFFARSFTFLCVFNNISFLSILKWSSCSFRVIKTKAKALKMFLDDFSTTFNSDSYTYFPVLLVSFVVDGRKRAFGLMRHNKSGISVSFTTFSWSHSNGF